MAETLTLTDLIARKIELRAKIDDATAALKALDEQDDRLDAAILDAMRAQGMDDDSSVKVNGYTASIRRQKTVRYDPERWSELVKWAADTGNDYIIQRRLSDAKIWELVTSGTVPPGITLDSHQRLEFRRSR